MPAAKGFNTYRDYDWMYERYVVKKMTLGEIAEEVGCSLSSISKWLRNLRIQTRSPREAANLSWTEERREEARRINREIVNRPEVKARMSEIMRYRLTRGDLSSPESKEKRACSH